MKICLYGSASEKIADVYKTEVYNLAKLLAEKGHTLVFGGGCFGLMGAAARGASAGGGKIISVVPEFFKEGEVNVLYDNCDKVYPCETMYQRKQIMEEISDAFIVTPGGIGTYDEFFGVTATFQLNRHRKPIALFNVNGFFDCLNQMIINGYDEGFIRDYKSLYCITENPSAVIDYLEKIVNNRPIGALF